MSDYHPNLDGPAEPIGLAMLAEDKKAPSSLAQAPGSGLDTKLAALRYCIAENLDEDALAHLFDLITALRVRAAVTGVSKSGLTPEGKASLEMLSPNNLTSRH